MRASLKTSWISARIGLELWLQGFTRQVAVMLGVLSLIALLGLVAVSAQAAERGPRPRGPATLTYAGETFRGGPVIASVARGGRTLRRLLGAIEMTCTDGTDTFSMVTVASWRVLRISRGGSFGSHSEDSSQQGGDTVNWTESVSGRFNRARTSVTGHWQEKFVVHQPDGSTVTCDSGSLGFDADR
jgi:hypothetical protein